MNGDCPLPRSTVLYVLFWGRIRAAVAIVILGHLPVLKCVERPVASLMYHNFQMSCSN